MSGMAKNVHSENDPVEVEAREMVDVTSLFKDAAASLSVTNSMLCNEQSFTLLDSMGALELMDPKMDCCEIPVSQVAPIRHVGSDNSSTSVADEHRMVFPRPAPLGLDDIVDPLPWNDLTIQDAAYIALECLIRLESFVGGASVVDSTFTCLYAHKAVVQDMKQRLEPASLTEQMQAIMKPNAKGTTAQRVVYVSILLLLELSDVILGIILNADIYEEEDFSVGTYGIDVFNDRDEKSVINQTRSVLEAISALENHEDDEVQAIGLILGFQLDLLLACSSLAKLARKAVVKQVEQSQKLVIQAATKLEQLTSIAKRMKENQPHTIEVLLKRTFDSYVNRPLVGNAPVRSIKFRELGEAISSLVTITKEIDWALCRIILKGNTIGRIRRLVAHLSASSVNILTRSLLVLNLYFDDKLFGQYTLPEMIVHHMQQLSHIPDSVFLTNTSLSFLNRLAKPIYDIMKLQLLNRNRQRSYIEAVMLHDWASLTQEARIVDLTLKNDEKFGPSVPPHFSIYVLYITVELMDHFIALAVELKLFCGNHELAVANWYRDFLLSALINQLSSMRQLKADAKSTQQAAAASCGAGQKRGKKKGGKAHKKPSNGQLSPEDLEDEFDFLALNLKRFLCRGTVRVSVHI